MARLSGKRVFLDLLKQEGVEVISPIDFVGLARSLGVRADAPRPWPRRSILSARACRARGRS